MSRNIPLYIKVLEQLLDMLRDGVYKPGDQLPSEAELAAEMGVSLITIRRAMQELSSEGWVSRQPGRGTFASKPTKIEQPVSVLSSFSADMRALGIVPSSVILKQEVVPSQLEQADALQVEVGTQLFHLFRIRLGDGIPILLESVYIPLDVCPELARAEFEESSLYETLTQYGVELTKSTQEFEPIVLTEEQGERLQIPALTPAFLRKATSYRHDKPIEWVESIYRKDKFRFVVETGKYSPKLLLVSK